MTTLRARLFRGHLLLLCLALAALLGVAAWAMRATLERDADQLLADKLTILVRAVDKAHPDRQYLMPWEKISGEFPVIWQVRTADGEIALMPAEAGHEIPLSDRARKVVPLRDPPLPEMLVLKNGELARSASYPVEYQGTILAYAQVALPQRFITARWQTFLTYLAGGGLGVVAVASLLLHLWQGRWFRTLTLAGDSARRLSESRLAEGRLAVADDEPEIAELATAFNQLLTRIEHANLSQRRFVADASHELRTPLTILRGEIDVILRKARPPAEYEATLRSAREELVRLSRLVENLLALAHADTGEVAPAREVVDLCDLARTVAERFGAVADEKSVMLQVDAPHPVAVRGEPAALESLIGNLVDNALRHTSGGEEESVRVRVAEEDGDAVVTVRDTGTGIGPEHLPHLFERFYRVDSARTRAGGGAGLGLAIVKSIAEAHLGTVEVASELGRGSVFTLRLPAEKICPPPPPAELREKAPRAAPNGAATT